MSDWTGWNEQPGAQGAPWLDQGFERVDCDAVGDGYDRITVRADVVPHLTALRDELRRLGGVLTSSGGRRSLSVGGSDTRAALSLHHTGAAFDLAVNQIGKSPLSDPFLVTEAGRDDRGRPVWRVWARVRQGGIEHELEAVDWLGRSGGYVRRPVVARVVDFTAMAERHGFTPIPPRKAWRSNHYAREFWHFNCSQVMPIGTTWADALLAAYSEAEILRATGGKRGLWSAANRRKIFNGRGFIAP